MLRRTCSSTSVDDAESTALASDARPSEDLGIWLMMAPTKDADRPASAPPPVSLPPKSGSGGKGAASSGAAADWNPPKSLENVAPALPALRALRA